MNPDPLMIRKSVFGGSRQDFECRYLKKNVIVFVRVPF